MAALREVSLRRLFNRGSFFPWGTHMHATLIRSTLLAAALSLSLSGAVSAGGANKTGFASSGSSSALPAQQLIVTFEAKALDKSARAALYRALQAGAARAQQRHPVLFAQGTPNLVFVRELSTGGALMRLTTPLGAQQVDTLARALADIPGVLQVEPDMRLHAMREGRVGALMQAAFDPDDEFYARNQWHLQGTPGGANVAAAWELADGEGVTVAVLDTGITDHPDLDVSLADSGYDFIADAFTSGRDNDGRAAGGWDLGDWTHEEQYRSCWNPIDPSDQGDPSSWHGTHVSGIIAERTNNGVGLAGIAYHARVLPVRVLGHCGGALSDIAEGIVWAAGGHVDGVPDNPYPAQVINLSLGGVVRGGCTQTPTLAAAISAANVLGATVVVAAGNSAMDTSDVVPASCPGAIAVSANGATGKSAFYSNYGQDVALSAPGGGYYVNDDPSTGEPARPEGFVWSAINLGDTTPADPGYAGYVGTSMAAPHVAGVVALVQGVARDAGKDAFTPIQVRHMLTETARSFPVAPTQPMGAGIVDAFAAVVRALDGEAGGDTPLMLANGMALREQAGRAGESRLYAIDVPDGARRIQLRTFGGSGDVSLFVARDVAPEANGGNAEFGSVKPGNNETVVVSYPRAGRYFLRVSGQSDFEKVAVLVTYSL